MARAVSWGVPRARITPLSTGETVDVAGVRISHTPARHESDVAGWEVPDAMGIVLEMGERSVYHTGDTEYDLRLRALASRRVDVTMACINGTGGNMDAYEAALLAWRLGSPVVVPMHHYLWAGAAPSDEATLDPQTFADTYRALGGAGRVVIPEVGREIDIGG